MSNDKTEQPLPEIEVARLAKAAEEYASHYDKEYREEIEEHHYCGGLQEYLHSLPPSPVGEAEAIAFAKWLNNSWYTPHYAKWIHLREGLAGMKTAEELYAMFTADRPNPSRAAETGEIEEWLDEEIKRFSRLAANERGNEYHRFDGHRAAYVKVKDRLYSSTKSKTERAVEMTDQQVKMESLERVIKKVIAEAEEYKVILESLYRDLFHLSPDTKIDFDKIREMYKTNPPPNTKQL